MNILSCTYFSMLNHTKIEHKDPLLLSNVKMIELVLKLCNKKHTVKTMNVR